LAPLVELTASPQSTATLQVRDVGVIEMVGGAASRAVGAVGAQVASQAMEAIVARQPIRFNRPVAMPFSSRSGATCGGCIG
jgi:hypothetical protein